MSQTFTVHLEKPIVSAKILDGHIDGIGSELSSRDGADSGVNAGKVLIREAEPQKAVFSQACQALNSVIAKFNEFYDRVLVEHREEIAKLSVEIARKILTQKVENGDYEIESIVKEALKNAPSRQDVVVHLNPEDLTQCQKAQQDEQSDAFVGIKFVSDANIGRAECLLESSKGIVKSLIDENLERVSKALAKKD
ncbi:MAG: FliH/SctL family protein [Phycisphaerales bacterium]|jgi:flagellar biosynthesis/type III secretory pathway protein FliH